MCHYCARIRFRKDWRCLDIFYLYSSDDRTFDQFANLLLSIIFTNNGNKDVRIVLSKIFSSETCTESNTENTELVCLYCKCTFKNNPRFLRTIDAFFTPKAKKFDHPHRWPLPVPGREVNERRIFLGWWCSVTDLFPEGRLHCVHLRHLLPLLQPCAIVCQIERCSSLVNVSRVGHRDNKSYESIAIFERFDLPTRWIFRIRDYERLWPFIVDVLVAMIGFIESRVGLRINKWLYRYCW